MLAPLIHVTVVCVGTALLASERILPSLQLFAGRAGKHCCADSPHLIFCRLQPVKLESKRLLDSASQALLSTLTILQLAAAQSAAGAILLRFLRSIAQSAVAALPAIWLISQELGV